VHSGSASRQRYMTRYTIDRFEGPEWAVLQDEQGTTFLVPRRWLPTQARERDVVVEGDQAPDTDTVSLRLQLDPRQRAEHSPPDPKEDTSG
jgi:hypothetical protein